jgi:hypothetical protein
LRTILTRHLYKLKLQSLISGGSRPELELEADNVNKKNTSFFKAL